MTPDELRAERERRGLKPYTKTVVAPRAKGTCRSCGKEMAGRNRYCWKCRPSNQVEE